MTRLVAFVLVAIWSGGAWGGEIVHRLSSGERLEDVAEAYWGNPSWADLLRSHNKLPAGRAATGASIRVPVSTDREVRAGDTWDSLADTAFGDPALGRMLAALNRSPSASVPAPGETVRLPGLAIHTLAPGETLAALARRYLRDGDLWPLIARLNRIKQPDRLFAGSRVRVPVLSAPATGAPPPPVDPPLPAFGPPAPTRLPERSLPGVAAGPPQVAPAPLSAPPPSRRAWNPELRVGFTAYEEGRYEKAREILESVRDEVLQTGSREDQIRLLEHLTFVHIAFGDTARACGAYRRLRAMDPEHRWDPVMISPKISRTTSLCDLD